MVQLLKDIIIEKAKDFFLLRPEVKFAYLFGSIASGKSNKLSDVDIAVFVEEDYFKKNKFSYGYKAALITDLSRALKINEVDLIILNNASALIKHRVLSRGKLIICQDDSRRINFQVKTLNEYSDFKYLFSIHN